MSIFQNARVYWEMYGGVPPEGNDQHVQALNLSMDVGGWAADDYAYFQVSVYGRKTIDSPNIETIYRAPVHRPTGSIMWKPVRISERVTNTDVRCIVVKVELIEQTYVAPDGSSHVMNYSDQYMDADAPPWGIRIHEASIYGSDLVRDVRAHRVFADILAGRGFTYSGPVATWTPDQLDFTDIPYDRQDAIDDVNGMLGWNYACWDGEEIEFAHPKSGTAHVIAASDPRTTWSVEESLDETYNAVRVCYGNKAGKPREVIVHGSTAALHGTVRADTLQAPESIKSEKAARRFAKRYLASHETKQVAGSVSIQGMTPDVPGFSATGGTVSYDGAYTVHRFTADDTLVCSGAITARVLRVGGGAGGSSGGAGAGGVIPEEDAVLTGSMPVTVGDGGLGHNGAIGGGGEDTVFAGKTAKGGGGGGKENGTGGAGGSGGGGGAGSSPTIGGTATPSGQGHDGGGNGGYVFEPWGAGGGGGASEIGQTAPDATHAGHGGAGINSDIVLRGTNVGYAGGGGASEWYGGTPGTASHGGGAGSPAGGVPGAVNTGGAGGGGDYDHTGGDGGSGIVVVRYLTTPDIVGLDPLLIRPGDTVKMTGPARSLSGEHEVTRVTLRPLEWTADVEFGTNSKRFDTWLARLAAGAKSIKRR